MPRAEKGSIKDIANRAKAKGLQKLRFYCQMCQKQCRDENGFKCHLTSESHLRQMKIFQENSNVLMDQFSKEFEGAYLDNLRRRHSTTKVNANNVYQEVIRERHHIHMNSTCWATLSDFVQYLGKTGKCTVEETERGWYIQYIDRDPAMLKRQEQARRKAEAEREQEFRFQKRIEQMRREAAEKDGGSSTVEQATNLDKSRLGSTKISLAAPSTTKNKSKRPLKILSLAENGFDSDSESSRSTGAGDSNFNLANPKQENTSHPDVANPSREGHDDGNSRMGNGKKRKRFADQSQHGATGETKAEKDGEAQSKGKSVKKRSEPGVISLVDRRKEYWLKLDIVVRVIAKKLADGLYYKRKAVVTKLIDKYTAQVKILDSGPDKDGAGDILQLDQDDLETVIPQEIDKRVLIVNGRGRGEEAMVTRLDRKKYQADLVLERTGQEVKKVDFEDFCLLA